MAISMYLWVSCTWTKYRSQFSRYGVWSCCCWIVNFIPRAEIGMYWCQSLYVCLFIRFYCRISFSFLFSGFECIERGMRDRQWFYSTLKKSFCVWYKIIFSTSSSSSVDGWIVVFYLIFFLLLFVFSSFSHNHASMCEESINFPSLMVCVPLLLNIEK